MPRTSLTTQAVPLAGLTPTFTAAVAAGEIADVGSGVRLLVQNGAGSSITVTIGVPGKIDGDLSIGPRIVTCPAGGLTVIPLNSANYKQPATSTDAPGRAYVDYSAVTSVTRAVVGPA